MDDGTSALEAARPASGDLVDRVLEAKLRARLFGDAGETTLGRLRVDGVLGRGGMGAIVSAFDPVLDRHVAVKTLHTGAGGRDQLLREARTLAKLSHANVVPVYDVIEDATGVYLVMERVAGGNLREWIGAPRTWREIVALFVQIGHGLAAAHALGIVHCDIKPENVVVSDGRPRLIDFGLAALEAEASHAGTRAYLAPERIAGGTGSAAADQYAYFASLAEATRGMRVPAWLAAAISRGMDPDPAKRFPTMTAAVAALDHTPPVVRVAIGMAIAAVVALIAVIVVQRMTTRDDTCAPIATSWTPERHVATVARFVATGAPHAAETAARVTAKLDRYATDWTAQRTRSCVATNVHHTQSSALLDGSIACFDRQLATLAGIADLFGAPDARIVNRADPTLDDLGDLASCTDPTALAQAIALPADPAQRARVHALTERYEAAKNLDRRGDHKGALAAVDSLLADARAVNFVPLTARVLVLHGAIQVTLADPKGAEATFHEAASAAAQAHDDKLVAEVWTRTLELLAQQGRFDDALTLEPVAVASTERVANERALVARLSNALGGIYLAKARYPDAYRAYAKAFELQKRIGPDGNAAYTPALANLALAKWYAGDPRGGMNDLEEALTRMTAELGPDHSSLAYVHENLADIAHQLGDAAAATPHYNAALRIWTASLGPTHPNLAYPLEQLALVDKETHDYAAAREAANRALALREQGLGTEHPLVAQTLTVVAEVELADGKVAPADAAISRALKILDKLGEAGKRQRMYVLAARAHADQLRGDLGAEARDYREALALTISLLGPDHGDTALAHQRLASTLARHKELAAAAESYAAARRIYDLHPDVNTEAGITARIEEAAVATMRGDAATARTLLTGIRERAAHSPQLPAIEAALAKITPAR